MGLPGVAYGMASVLVSVEAIAGRPLFAQSCGEFMAKRGVAALAVMAFVADPAQGGPRRELILVTRSAVALVAVQEAFVGGEAGASLELKPLVMGAPGAVVQPGRATLAALSAGIELPGDSGGGFLFGAAYSQLAVGKSRKQAMPLFHGALSGIGAL